MAKTSSNVNIPLSNAPVSALDLPTSSATAPSISELVRQIESMSGKEKQAFCKTLSADQKKQYIGYLRDRDMETITAVFRCFEPMGGSVKLTVRPYENCEATYEFVDGHTYTIPLYLARRFNNEYQGCGTWYPTHAHIMDQFGKPMVGVGKRNHRFGMNSPNLM